MKYINEKKMLFFINARFRNRDMQLVVEVSNEEDSNLAWTMVSGTQLRLLPPYATIKTVFSMVALNHGLQVCNT